MNATLLPTLALAENARHIAQARLRNSQQQVWLLDRHGKVIQHVSAEDLSRPLATGFRDLRRMNKDELTQKVDAIRSFQKANPKYASLGSLTLSVYEALQAPTAAEYHAKVKALPVEIRARDGKDTDGRDGVIKEYVVKGQTRIVTFTANDGGASSSSPGKSHGPAVLDDCYDDPFTPSGPNPCATEEEVDDAYTEIAAMDSDADSVQSSVSSENDSYCNWHTMTDEDYCQAFYDDDVNTLGSADARSDLAAMGIRLAISDKPTTQRQSVIFQRHANANTVRESGPMVALGNCTSKGLWFASSLAGWAGARLAIIAVLATAGTLSGIGLAIALVAIVGSNCALIASAMDLIDCMHTT